MKKILTFAVIALFVVSIPLAAQAGGIKAMEGKVAALLGDKAAQQTYNYNAIFAYSDNTDYWWTGLVIFNISDAENSFLVGCFDTAGNAVAGGEFSLAANGSVANLLDAFMTSGSVSGRVSAISVFATGDFVADRFVGNTEGGFGEIEKEAEYY
jgi:hypothetical protein